MDNADRIQEIKNPLCGDVMTLFLNLEGDRIDEAGFQSQSCSICTASSSMLASREIISQLLQIHKARPAVVASRLSRNLR